MTGFEPTHPPGDERPAVGRRLRRAAFGVFLLGALVVPLAALVFGLLHPSDAAAPQSCVAGRHQCRGPIQTTLPGN